MVAPRTLQALALDSSFPSGRINRWLAQWKKIYGEPVNATLVTIIIALVFVALGSVNAVAEIISMFFLVTYGSLCLISFLKPFRIFSFLPSFIQVTMVFIPRRFLIALWVMFKINAPYAFASLLLMTALFSYNQSIIIVKEMALKRCLPMPYFSSTGIFRYIF
jgi:hypothetical protein